MSDESSVTRMILSRWRSAASDCFSAIGDGKDLEKVGFIAFKSWGPEPIVDALDLLSDLLGPRLCERGINPEPFYRAVERARSFQLIRVEHGTDDVSFQDLALASLRAGLDYATCAANTLRKTGGGKSNLADPPKPPKRKGRTEDDPIRNARILDLFDSGIKKTPAIVAKLKNEGWPGITNDAVDGVLTRNGRSRRNPSESSE